MITFFCQTKALYKLLCHIRICFAHIIHQFVDHTKLHVQRVRCKFLQYNSISFIAHECSSDAVIKFAVSLFVERIRYSLDCCAISYCVCCILHESAKLVDIPEAGGAMTQACYTWICATMCFAAVQPVHLGVLTQHSFADEKNNISALVLTSLRRLFMRSYDLNAENLWIRNAENLWIGNAENVWIGNADNMWIKYAENLRIINAANLRIRYAENLESEMRKIEESEMLKIQESEMLKIWE